MDYSFYVDQNSPRERCVFDAKCFKRAQYSGCRSQLTFIAREFEHVEMCHKTNVNGNALPTSVPNILCLIVDKQIIVWTKRGQKMDVFELLCPVGKRVNPTLVLAAVIPVGSSMTDGRLLSSASLHPIFTLQWKLGLLTSVCHAVISTEQICPRGVEMMREVATNDPSHVITVCVVH